MLLFGLGGGEDYLSIDFGASAIKIARANFSGSEVNVTLSDSHPVPTVSPDEFVEVHSEILGKLIDRNSISSGSKVVLALPANNVIVRRMELPAMPEERLAQAIRYEAESHIPFPLDQVVMDHHVIEKSEEGTDLILSAVKEENLNKFIDVIHNVELNPEIIDIAAFANFNFYNYLRGEELKPAPPAEPPSEPEEEDEEEAEEPAGYARAIVDVGHANTDIVVAKNGALAFARSASVAGESITEEIAKQMDIDLDEARELKEEYGHLPLDDLEVDTGEDEGMDALTQLAEEKKRKAAAEEEETEETATEEETGEESGLSLGAPRAPDEAEEEKAEEPSEPETEEEPDEVGLSLGAPRAPDEEAAEEEASEEEASPEPPAPESAPESAEEEDEDLEELSPPGGEETPGDEEGLSLGISRGPGVQEDSEESGEESPSPPESPGSSEAEEKEIEETKQKDEKDSKPPSPPGEEITEPVEEPETAEETDSSAREEEGLSLGAPRKPGSEGEEVGEASGEASGEAESPDPDETEETAEEKPPSPEAKQSEDENEVPSPPGAPQSEEKQETEGDREEDKEPGDVDSTGPEAGEGEEKISLGNVKMPAEEEEEEEVETKPGSDSGGMLKGAVEEEEPEEDEGPKLMGTGEDSGGEKLMGTESKDAGEDKEEEDKNQAGDSLGAAANGEESIPEISEEKMSRIGKAVKPQVDRLIGELRHTFDYFQSQLEGGEIDGLVITGGSSKLKNLDTYMSEQLGYPAEKFDPAEEIKGGNPGENQEMLVSYGLQLRARPEAASVNVNLVPDNLIRRRRARKKTQKMTALGIIGGIFLVLVLLTGFLLYSSRQQELQELEYQLERLEVVVQQVEELEETQQEVQELVDAIERLENERTEVLPLLSEINRLPGDLRETTWFNNLSLQRGMPDSSLSVSGLTGDYEAVSSLFRWLEGRPYIVEHESESMGRTTVTIEGRERTMVDFSADYTVSFDDETGGN